MANNVISFDKLGKTIDDILEKYGVVCNEIVEEEVNDITKEAVKKLKATSPRKTGKYAKGWKVVKYQSRFKVVGVIHNAKKPQLTHLLENGHAKRNGVGRVSPEKHIAPVEEWAVRELVERIERRLSE